MIDAILEKLFNHNNLSIEESKAAADKLMKGEVNNSRKAALLTALKIKGETSEEIAGFAKAMRENGIKITSTDPSTIDVCGTGGDNSGSFNISTAVAFVVAGAGVSVAKHGNRSITSKSGSSDVLTELGVKIDFSPQQAEEALNKVGITFLFAPIYHPAMKNVAPIRLELKFKTIFNILGPLTNPAEVQKQMIGTYNEKVAKKMVEAAKLLDMKNVTFVCTNNQYDEITLSHKAKLFSLSDSAISTKEIEPDEFGYEYLDLKEIAGSSPDANAKIIMELFKNPKRNAHFKVVTANSAVALLTSGKFDSLNDSTMAAEESLLSGRAYNKLKALVNFKDSK